jgi:Bacterial membrane protein YfhO
MSDETYSETSDSRWLFSLTARPRLLIAALLTLLPFIFFYPAVFGQFLLAPGDGWHQNFGVRVLIGQMLAQGTLPLWNPLIFAGTPLLASVYPGAFYPPNWLFAIFSPGIAMNLVVITTFHLALVGAYLYARRVGMRRTSALVMAMIFAFGGFMISHIGHTSRIAAAAWLPWVLLAIEELSVQVRWRWVVFGACFVALQFLAGEPQMLVLTALICGPYAILCAASLGDWRKRLHFAGYAVALVVGGVLLAAVQLLPARELHAQSGRAIATYQYFSDYALPLPQLFALIFPYFFGGAVVGPYHTLPLPTSFWGQWEYHLATGYAGLMGLLLAFYVTTHARRNPKLMFWVCVAVLGVLLALGPALPFDLNRLLFYIPGLNVFRGHYRHLLEFNFAIAVLAGWGVDRLAKADRWRLAVSTGMLTTLVALTAIVYVFFARQWGGTKAAIAPSLTLANAEAWVPLCLSGAAILAVWWHARHASRATAAFVVIVLFADLASFGHFFGWRLNAEKLQLINDPPAVAFIKAREREASSFRIVSYTMEPFAATGNRYEASNYPNLSIVRGLQSVNGYDALRLERLAAISGAQTEAGVILDPTAFSEPHVGYDLLNVKYLLREPSDRAVPQRWQKLASFEGVEVYENQRSRPRAWLVGQLAVQSQAEVLRTIREGRLSNNAPFNPSTTALLETEDFGGQEFTLPPLGAITQPQVQVTRYEPHRIELETNNPQAAFLVLSEVYYRGWDARIDGQKAPVYRANYVLRGLAVPGGKHRIEFLYRAPSLRTGAMYAGLGCLFLLAGAIITHRRRPS